MPAVGVPQVTEPASVELDEPRVRDVDPFAFFVGHASAIVGFGGEDASPDARYCLHTSYLDLVPGQAQFRIRMTEPRATRGELTIRVHAFRPGAESEVGMAAADKLRFDQLDGSMIDKVLRFTVLEGLQYALFGYFTEETDLRIAAIHVTVEELGGTVPVRANLGNESISRFARTAYATSHRLIAGSGKRGQRRAGLSQAYVADDVDRAAMQAEWPDVAAVEADALRQWETITALRALDLVGVNAGGARGLLIGAAPLSLEYELVRRDIHLYRGDSPFALSAEGADVVEDYGTEREGGYDFIVSYAMARAGPTLEGRLQIVGAGLRCLCGRGVGLFVMPFWTGNIHEPRPPAAAACLDRNAVQQIALRLIGQSYSVSQLAFPSPPRRGGGEITSFILIAHKLA